MFVCLFIGGLLFVSGECTNKRLLLNDPDIVARVHQLELTVQSLVSEITVCKQQKASVANNGAVYTIWGRKQCPTNGTEMLYSGTVGGGGYNSPGAPSDYLCLPHDPDFLYVDTRDSTYVSTLYGAEYESTDFGKNLHNNDVPCAVCRATHRSSILMIPGKTKCSNNWKREYYGRMASNADVNKASSQYICVDDKPEALEAGSANHNGKLLYSVKASCGSLRCPPFHNNAVLSCVVCSN